MEMVTKSDGTDENAWDQYTYHLDKFNKFDWCSNWDGQTYDIVFYGVSGYTGYLMMEYLKRISIRRNPEPFTFAFAGRTRSKVQDLRDKEFAGTKYEDTPVLQMSYDDIFSVIDLVKSARVIINVAGPYMLTQGELMIDACCCMGRHYVDISGEIPWSCRVLDLHNYAVKEKAYIIPSAAAAGGYPDLGVYLCAKKIREDFGEEIRTAICYNTGGGAGAGSSGGTLKTRAAMSSSGDEVRMKMADPYALGGFIPQRDRNGIKVCQIEFGTGKVTPKVRQEDFDANMSKVSEDTKLGVWRGPFTYSYFDTRIVRRSNMLFADLGGKIYGRNLNFMEYAMLPTEALMQAAAPPPPPPQPAAAAPAAPAPEEGGGGEGGGEEAAPPPPQPPPQEEKRGGGGVSVEAEKAMLEAQGKYYKEGEGPPLETLDDAWTGYFLYAESATGNSIRCSMVGRDGYFETARVAVETAMCLRFDNDELPFQGGVLTPTVACGDALFKRILDTGVKFKMGDWIPMWERSPPPYP